MISHCSISAFSALEYCDHMSMLANKVVQGQSMHTSAVEKIADDSFTESVSSVPLACGKDFAIKLFALSSSCVAAMLYGRVL